MIKEVIGEVLGEIGPDVKLVIAVKYASLEQIQEVIASGVDVGFNTLQQFGEVRKSLDLSDTRTHFIGNIQSNKIKKIVELRPFLIQSVSSFEIAEKINLICKMLGVKQKILLQISTDSEKTSGFSFDEIEDAIVKIKELNNLEICGFMTIPPTKESIGEERLREIYKTMKYGYNRLQRAFEMNFEFLSMGMSSDYLIAIEEGANMVRVGRKIFD